MDESAMRGIDYRCDGKMTLAIAKSFTNMREAMQGYKRVGRQDDKCLRVLFKDVPLVDPIALKAQKLKAIKFIASM